MKMLLALLCLLCCLPVKAAPPAVLIILLPSATLQDWRNADTPALHRLMQTGALAVMNTRTAHQAGRTEVETPQAALLTLGAGARAAGTSAPDGFRPASSAVPGMTISAAALFQRRTGTAAARPGQSVCLDWPAAAARNRNLGYDLGLGNLADTLNAHGVSVAAGGGADADWLAAGSSGMVPQATRLRAAPGLCLIWDAGPDIKAADAVLANAAAQVASRQGCLIVLSPLAGGLKDRQLAPVLLWGPGVPAGLLDSPSTHRSGLVTNTDFAPSVAAVFGISRQEFHPLPFGFAWSARQAGNSAHICERVNKDAVQQSHGMQILPYLAAVLALWILAVTALASYVPLPKAAFFVPLAALAAALFAVSALSFGFLLLAFIGLSARLRNKPQLVAAGAGLLVLALCADMVTGNTLMHRGLLGYSALEGARYYGIGNEAMGLLLGASLFCVGSWWQAKKLPQAVLLGGMASTVVLLGSAGAKAGGVLVSLAVFGTFLFAASGRRWTPKPIAQLAVVVLAGMALAALGEAFLHTGSPTHIGEAVTRIASGGSGEAWDIVRRKLAVEGRLAYHSAWALLLWLGLGCTGWLWKAAPAGGSGEKALRSAEIVGIFACLLLNDAGVVAAAIFGVFSWTAAVTQTKSLPVLDESRTGRQSA